MSLVKIDAATPLAPLPEAVAALELERPSAGARWSGASFELAGRVVGRFTRPAAIEVRLGGRTLRRLPVDRFAEQAGSPRNLWERQTGGSFQGLVSTLGLAETLQLEVAVVFASGAAETVAWLEGSREPARPSFDPTLQPLTVTALGREASIRTMALLAAHPQIVALRREPYEGHAAAYWLGVAAALAAPALEPAGFDEEGIPAGALPAAAAHLSREPRPGAGLCFDSVADFCQRSIDGWYRALAQDQVKPAARYFAERRVPAALQPALRELYPRSRELFVVRDFRSWATSRPPGYRRAGERDARRYATRALDFVSRWDDRRRDALLVRFEDLTQKPGAVLRRIFEHLGLDARDATIAALLAEARADGADPRARLAAAPAPAAPPPGPGDESAELLDRLLSRPFEAFGYFGGIDLEENATLDLRLGDWRNN